MLAFYAVAGVTAGTKWARHLPCSAFLSSSNFVKPLPIKFEQSLFLQVYHVAVTPCEPLLFTLQFPRPLWFSMALLKCPACSWWAASFAKWLTCKHSRRWLPVKTLKGLSTELSMYNSIFLIPSQFGINLALDISQGMILKLVMDYQMTALRLL